MNYREFDDNELIDYISEQNEEASDILFKKYEPLIRTIANKMYPYSFNSGLEVSDLIQEGMIGFSTAISTYKDNKDASFYTYATKCIKNRMISAVVASRRFKQKFLNEAIPIHDVDDSDEKSLGIESTYVDESLNPENIFMDIERHNYLVKEIKGSLTELEEQVFDLRVSGFDYKEIATILDKNPKSIDNALQRIKSKAKKLLKFV